MTKSSEFYFLKPKIWKCHVFFLVLWLCSVVWIMYRVSGRHWVLLVSCLGNKIKYLSGNLVKYSDSLKVTSIIAHINGGAWIKRRQAEWEQCITIHYTLHCIVTQQTVFIMSTQMIQRHRIYCQRGLSGETIEPILGSLWRILTYNAKETSAKASKKDKSQARQCQLWQNLSTNSDPGRKCLQCVGTLTPANV